MNKDIDNIDSTDKSVEKALDIMESSSEINVEQLHDMLKDEDTMQACRDIMDSSLFLQQKSGMELPNIEMELERFKKKQYTARMRSNFWKVSMGIAAMIAVLFGTYYLINTLTTPALEPITVFTADAAPQHITLQKDNGEKIVLDEPQSNNQTLPQKMISKSEKKELDYRQVISTTTQTHVLTVPRGESFKVVLCDGTEVWLNANSNFVYPTAFIGDERIVTLEGEAYFEVTKDTKRPFSVQNETLDVQVLGTVFNMNCDKNRQLAEVSLIRGSVKVTGKHDEGMIVLSSGQKAELNKSTKQMHVRTFNTQLDAVWHDGMIPFEDATISEIVSTLQHLYKTEIILSPDIDKSTYSGVIYQKENLDSVLLNLTLAMPIEYTKKEGKIYIKPIKK